MGIYLKIRKRRRNIDYLFFDEVSLPTYENALFRLTFNYDSLKIEQIQLITEYLENISNNLIEILNGSDESSIHSGSHEDRIKALEEEILTLTNNVNSQTTTYGTLIITPTSENIDFNVEGTMIKFTNTDNGVYTTSILKKDTENEIILPIGEYKVNIVNTLNDMTDAIFLELWEDAISDDDNHTMTYTIEEGVKNVEAKIEPETINDG